MTASATKAPYKGASAAAIESHYDLDNDFYALWLDRTRTYSCALWADEQDTLQTAQERKLDYLALEARASGAARVLDVGCGWGGMLRRLVDCHEVGSVVGLTLSRAQAGFIRDWSDRRYDVRVQNWMDHAPVEPYDAIVSIGAFEHFADYGMTRAERLESYRAFFHRCREWLPPGGRLAVQTNVKGNNVRLDPRMRRDFRFVIEHVFPESELPWLSEIFEASERRFEVLSMRNDPAHYARTCRAWLDNLVANSQGAASLVGSKAVADYERYLSGAAAAFDKQHIGLVRLVFARV